jgi:hypothetical protein
MDCDITDSKSVWLPAVALLSSALRTEPKQKRRPRRKNDFFALGASGAKSGQRSLTTAAKKSASIAHVRVALGSCNFLSEFTLGE